MTVARQNWQWFGHAGHFICSRWCQFHLCTQVGDYLVSTVGEYCPDAPVREVLAESRGIKLEGRGDARLADYMRKIGFEKIGCDRLYETMVFKAGPPCTAKGCDCGMPVPTEWGELDFRGYQVAREAREGHLEVCLKWARRSDGQPDD